MLDNINEICYIGCIQITRIILRKQFYFLYVILDMKHALFYENQLTPKNIGYYNGSQAQYIQK